jgi:phosphoenolpyruvate-protein phosphotransferase (PTS system enzyme I)
MTRTAPAPAVASAPTVLTGTPVVPGVALGPVVRPSGSVLLPEGGRRGRRSAR